MLKNKLLILVCALLGFAVTAERAAAHATSIGFENGGAPGAVIVWLGTYAHGNHHLEGSMNLVGVNGNAYPSTTNPFTLGAGAGPAPTFGGTPKPAGLVDGITHFYNPNGCAMGSAPLVSTPNTCGGGVDHWQGALFTGLGAGDYQFTWTPIANPSAEWSILNSNMNGVFTLGEIVVGGCGGANQPPCATPTPASLPLLALGLIGMATALRRRQKKAA